MPHRPPHKSTIQSHQPPCYRPHYLIVTIAPMAPRLRKTSRVPTFTDEMDTRPPIDGADNHSIDAACTNIDERSATGSNTTDIQHDDVLVAASSKAIDTLDVTSNNTTMTQRIPVVQDIVVCSNKVSSLYCCPVSLQKLYEVVLSDDVIVVIQLMDETPPSLKALVIKSLPPTV